MMDDRMVDCSYFNKLAPGLVVPPMPGPLGKKIYNSVSQKAWDLWLVEQTKLMNEQRLDPMDSVHREKILIALQTFLALE